MSVIATDKKSVIDADTMKELVERARLIEEAMKSEVDPFAVLDALNEAIDFGLSCIIGTLGESVTCKKGCSHCCHIAVYLTGLEARYIENRTGIAMERYAGGEPCANERRPCPFLEDNACSIYQYRPVTCRMFLSFDDLQYCVDEQATHKMLHLNYPGMGGFEFANALYEFVMTHYLSKHTEYRVFNDIRDFFGAKRPKNGLNG